MPVIGLNFTLISGERKKEGKITGIKTSHPKITSVKKVKLEGISKKGVDILDIGFELNSDIEPVANIKIAGTVKYKTDNTDTLMKKWEKEKKLPTDQQLEILNYIMRKALVKALILSDSLNLPPVIQIPRFTKK